MTDETRTKYIDFIVGAVPEESKDGMRRALIDMKDGDIKKRFDMCYAAAETRLKNFIKDKGWDV